MAKRVHKSGKTNCESVDLQGFYCVVASPAPATNSK